MYVGGLSPAFVYILRALCTLFAIFWAAIVVSTERTGSAFATWFVLLCEFGSAGDNVSSEILNRLHSLGYVISTMLRWGKCHIPSDGETIPLVSDKLKFSNQL